MSGKINLKELRADIHPPTGDPSEDIVVLNTEEVLALVEGIGPSLYKRAAR